MFEKRNVIEEGRTPKDGVKQASLEENTLTRAADAVADKLRNSNGTDAKPECPTK